MFLWYIVSNFDSGSGSPEDTCSAIRRIKRRIGTSMSSHYAYGKRKELQLAEFLQRRGFNWERNPASRGPVDLIAVKGRLRLAIQVKATRSNSTSYTRLSRQEETRLL